MHWSIVVARLLVHALTLGFYLEHQITSLSATDLINMFIILTCYLDMISLNNLWFTEDIRKSHIDLIHIEYPVKPWRSIRINAIVFVVIL